MQIPRVAGSAAQFSRVTGSAAARSRFGLRGQAGLVSLTAAACLTGCAAAVSASAQPIQLANAYVMEPAAGSAAAYVVIDNPGPADRLIGARSSAGGQIQIIGPAGPAGPAPRPVRTVRAIRIPAASLVRLTPASFHLLISGARGLRAGTEITLTLLFTRAGQVTVGADVTNPQSGGGSYLGQ